MLQFYINSRIGLCILYLVSWLQCQDISIHVELLAIVDTNAFRVIRYVIDDGVGHGYPIVNMIFGFQLPTELYHRTAMEPSGLD